MSSTHWVTLLRAMQLPKMAGTILVWSAWKDNHDDVDGKVDEVEDR